MIFCVCLLQVIKTSLRNEQTTVMEKYVSETENQRQFYVSKFSIFNFPSIGKESTT